MRKINRAVKIRIYPNKEQITQIEKTIGCSRFLYNRMLADKIRHYQEEKKMLKNTPAGYKKEYPWLKEVDSLALANVQLNLEGAFRKFFREPGVGFPHYKSKKHSRKSYTTNMVNGNICLQDRFLKLPKMQPVKIKLHRMIPEGWKLKSVTVSREPSGKYFASLLFDCENQTAEKRQAEKFLGMDFAMHGMCVFSTGERAGYPMFYRNAEKKLAREQRKLYRCEKGYPLQGEIHKFYPDRISGTCMGSIGFSPIAVHKDERIVKAAEYHTTTWEGIVALDDDMIIHVAPASAGAPVPELTRAFIVPKGTMVKINAAIWHLCPLPLNNEVLHAMIILPECTYANDCTVVDFEEKDWFKITV